jgi:alpha-1,2-mannosyltransferase
LVSTLGPQPLFNASVARLADRAGDRLRSFAQPWELVCFLWLPSCVVGFAFWYLMRSDRALGDFPIFRAAAKSVLHGRSPYASPNPAALAHFDTFVYPPAAAFLIAPLAILPYDVGNALMFVLGLGAILAALFALEVRDWRCYGLAALSAPTVDSLALGALTSFLLLGAALTWRYRDRPGLCGIAASLSAVLKLFLWPLGLWLLATRRLHAFAVFAIVAVLAVLLGWAAIDFAGFRSYPQLLRVLSRLEAGVSYSPIALLHLPNSMTVALSFVLIAILVVTVVVAANGADGDRRSFTVAIFGSLLATPVLWLHYLALLFVPIALYRPRLSPLWFVPLVLWVTPTGRSDGTTWKIALALLVTVIVAVSLLGRRADGLEPAVSTPHT